MRYLILSDIHGNLEALQAVLAQAEGQYDLILNCGDLVGYGPDPNAVIETCRQRCAFVIRGNHDKASAGLSDLDWFNPVARASAVWTADALLKENLEWLRNLPPGPAEVEDFHLVHGSPADEDEYIVSIPDARDAASQAGVALSFFGHTHLQGGFEVHRENARAIPPDWVQVGNGSVWLINPGSVGQPRDGDPRAAYAIYNSDTRSVTYERASYPIETTYRKILGAGLPEMLGIRLFRGL